jgi:ubiquinone/menaquinone biosynthesis C-methylase UbiE
MHSHKKLTEFLHKLRFAPDAYILNAGSGGNNYGLPYKMHHVDIAENKISKFENHTVGSIESMPFPNETFTDIICVGSVLNYCDAVTAITELARVLKIDGRLILEFESSNGYGYILNKCYNQSATVVTVEYRNEPHVQWLYSYKYINSIVKAVGLQNIKSYGYHYISGICLSLGISESKSANYANFDFIARIIPVIKQHAHNYILTGYKKILPPSDKNSGNR